MKKVLAFLFFAVVFIACKKKLEPVYQPQNSSTPDASRGTCMIGGVVQNFDSSHVEYNSSSKVFYVYMYKNGFAAMNFTLNNYNWNNYPSYQQFPKGVGTYTYNFSSSNAGSYYGSFIDMSGGTAFSSQLQNGSVTITENDSINHRVSGTFSSINGTSSFNTYTFMNGQFTKVRAEYW